MGRPSLAPARLLEDISAEGWRRTRLHPVPEFRPSSPREDSKRFVVDQRHEGHASCAAWLYQACSWCSNRCGQYIFVTEPLIAQGFCPIRTPRPGGPMPAIQIEDLLRHGNRSVKSKQTNRFHEEALMFHLQGSLPREDALALMPFTPGCKERSITGAGFRAVSVSQLRISLETLHSPVGAQAAEYQRRCESQRKLAPERIPLHHCDPKVHGRILHAYADVLFQRARVELKSGHVQCIALAQDQVQLQHAWTCFCACVCVRALLFCRSRMFERGSNSSARDLSWTTLKPSISCSMS